MTTMGHMLVLALVLVFHSGSISGLRCLSCSNIQHPETCAKVIECTQGDSCFIQEHITSGGLVQYNTGCMFTRRCNSHTRGLAGLIGLRESRDTDLVTCVECCNGNYCNIEGCGQIARNRPDQGPLCFQCSNLDHPEECRDVVMCDAQHKCIIRYNLLNQLWSTGCSPDKQCETLRAYTSKVHCTACCDGDFCNDHCLDGTYQGSSTTHNVSLVGGGTGHTVSHLPTHSVTPTSHETSRTVQHISTVHSVPPTQYETSGTVRRISTTNYVTLTPHQTSRTVQPKSTTHIALPTQNETTGTIQRISTTNYVTPTPQETSRTVQPISTTQFVAPTQYESSRTVQSTSTTHSVTSMPRETSRIVQHMSTTLGSVSTTHTKTTHAPGCLNDKVDVIFLVDASHNVKYHASHSLDPNEWIRQLEFVQNFVNKLHVPVGTNGARFALITYSTHATNVIPLDNNLSKAQFIANTMQASYSGHSANLHHGLHLSGRLLDLQNLHRNAYVIALTNNEPDNTDQMRREGLALKANPLVTVFVLHKGNEQNSTVLRAVASNDNTFLHVKLWRDTSHIIDTITSYIMSRLSHGHHGHHGC